MRSHLWIILLQMIHHFRYPPLTPYVYGSIQGGRDGYIQGVIYGGGRDRGDYGNARGDFYA